MAKAFESPRRNSGKGFPRALARLREFLAGGSVQDFRRITLEGAGPLLFVVEPNEAYEIRVTTSGSAGAEGIDLEVSPNVKVGQHLLITLEALTDSSDTVVLAEDASVTLLTDAVTAGTGGAVASVTFDTVGQFALLKYIGNDTWDIVVSDATIA